MNQYINTHLEIYVHFEANVSYFSTGDTYVNRTYTNTSN